MLRSTPARFAGVQQDVFYVAALAVAISRHHNSTAIIVTILGASTLASRWFPSSRTFDGLPWPLYIIQVVSGIAICWYF